MSTVRTALGALVAVGATAFGALALGGVATATDETCAPGWVATYSTVVSNRPDSGTNGTWAYDAFTRTTTVYDHCDGTYGVKLDDAGTFTTVAGTSPGDQAAPLVAGITGSFTGSASIVVTSETPPTDPGPTSDGSVGSSAWAGLLFAGNVGVLGDWGWTYATDCETWVNSSAGNSGDVVGEDCQPPTSTTTTTPPTTTTTDVTTTTSPPIDTTDPTSTTSDVVTVTPSTSTTPVAGLARPPHRRASVDEDLAYTGTSVVGPLVAVGALSLLIGAATLALYRTRRPSRR